MATLETAPSLAKFVRPLQNAGTRCRQERMRTMLPAPRIVPPRRHDNPTLPPWLRAVCGLIGTAIWVVVVGVWLSAVVFFLTSGDIDSAGELLLAPVAV